MNKFDAAFWEQSLKLVFSKNQAQLLYLFFIFNRDRLKIKTIFICTKTMVPVLIL
jgi:hypothetical protein